jgi:hypothetical protein
VSCGLVRWLVWTVVRSGMVNYIYFWRLDPCNLWPIYSLGGKTVKDLVHSRVNGGAYE